MSRSIYRVVPAHGTNLRPFSCHNFQRSRVTTRLNSQGDSMDIFSDSFPEENLNYEDPLPTGWFKSNFKGIGDKQKRVQNRKNGSLTWLEEEKDGEKKSFLTSRSNGVPLKNVFAIEVKVLHLGRHGFNFAHPQRESFRKAASNRNCFELEFLEKTSKKSSLQPRLGESRQTEGPSSIDGASHLCCFRES